MKKIRVYLVNKLDVSMLPEGHFVKKTISANTVKRIANNENNEVIWPSNVDLGIEVGVNVEIKEGERQEIVILCQKEQETGTFDYAYIGFKKVNSFSKMLQLRAQHKAELEKIFKEAEESKKVKEENMLLKKDEVVNEVHDDAKKELPSDEQKTPIKQEGGSLGVFC